MARLLLRRHVDRDLGPDDQLRVAGPGAHRIPRVPVQRECFVLDERDPKHGSGGDGQMAHPGRAPAREPEDERERGQRGRAPAAQGQPEGGVGEYEEAREAVDAGDGAGLEDGRARDLAEPEREPGVVQEPDLAAEVLEPGPGDATGEGPSELAARAAVTDSTAVPEPAGERGEERDPRGEDAPERDRHGQVEDVPEPPERHRVEDEPGESAEVGCVPGGLRFPGGPEQGDERDPGQGPEGERRKGEDQEEAGDPGEYPWERPAWGPGRWHGLIVGAGGRAAQPALE